MFATFITFKGLAPVSIQKRISECKSSGQMTSLACTAHIMQNPSIQIPQFDIVCAPEAYLTFQMTCLWYLCHVPHMIIIDVDLFNKTTIVISLYNKLVVFILHST